VRKASPGGRQPIARVLLRLPLKLHRSLVKAAAEAGLSFNEWCVRRLAAPAQLSDTSAVRGVVIGAARAAVGDRLLGVVAIGSWTRGEAAADSDIDVLIVVDPSVPLTRDLYRVWDAGPHVFDGRAIDAHFVHPYTPRAQPGSVWCEAAVDGLVWYDRDDRVAGWLVDIRRAIAQGRVVRAVAHGQPYWKGAA
jgi:predicted nucleotidyltransferase